MSFLDGFQKKLDKILTPLCTKIMRNKTVSAIANSMMKLMPVFIGGAIFSLIANFPWDVVTNFLTDVGVKPILDSFVTTQTNLQPIFLTFIISYTYAKNEQADGTVAGIFSLLMYFMLMPASISIGEQVISAYSTNYMGGQGIFAAMIIAIIVAKIYVLTVKKKLVFKLPDSVPPMVSKSFEPIYSGILIIGLGLLASFIFKQTSYGDFFTAIVTLVQTPIMNVGASVPAMLLFYTVVNLFWFFGIHPSALMAIFTPVLTTIMTSNVGAMMQGLEMPYVKEQLAYMVVTMGGTGCTLGLVFIMLIFGKSQRFKAMNKLCAAPGICNINEPLIFGMPLMMNPVFFFPMVLSAPINIALMTGFASLDLFSFNAIAAMATPWTMPWPITGFLAGGFPLALIITLIAVIDALLYLPFFIVADRKELAEEKNSSAQQQEA